MFQRFYDNTQISRVVKQLLATEPIPQLQVIHKGSPVIEGCTYIYEDEVVSCTSSGIVESKDYPPELVSKPGIAFSRYTHKSKESWYDSETHKQLGNYLRYLRDTTGVNLMQYYNCYNATELTDVYLRATNFIPLVCSPDLLCGEDVICGHKEKTTSKKTYEFGSLPEYKVVAIPIRFDTTYTIAVESYGTVTLRPIIYNQHGMVKKDDVSYYSDYFDEINTTCISYAHTEFRKPFEYRVDLATSLDSVSLDMRQELYSRQKDLYLLLQLPVHAVSSIVVLEGSYKNKQQRVVTQGNPHHEDYDCSADPNKTGKTTETYFCNLSLLNYNTGVSYAFSDRLVEYLLLNIVTPLETLSTNISRVQTSLSTLYSTYRTQLETKRSLLGVWDDSIQEHILELVYQNKSAMNYPMDHDGYINKDVEHLLASKGVYVT